VRSPRLLASVLATILVASTARSDGGADPVVATVGALPIHASDVQRRLAAMPDVQRRALASSPADLRRRVVETILGRDLQFTAEAERTKLTDASIVRARLRDALRAALVEALREEIHGEPIPDAEVQAYYAAHLGEFERPERIRIIRILVEQEPLARQIIDQAKRDDKSLEKWKQLAREHSVDSATKMRGGMLGFVAADGSTEVPQLAVDPALYAAAAKVKDGELVSEPVREGERFAVVWRRGTLPKVSRSALDVRPIIVQVLGEERLEKQVADLVAKGRAASVTDENPDLLDALPPEPAPPPPPPKTSGTPRPGDPAPKQTERGLR
jgi:peptidyl-prolyl cis-trans isomerase C